MLLKAPHQSYIVWKICITILHSLAVAVSAFRIWLQYRRCRMWWDDYFVILPVLFDIFYCITLLIVPPPGRSLASISRATNYWFSLFPSLTVSWLSRISFLLLLARLFPQRHLYRRITVAFVVMFCLSYLTSVALSVPRCDGVHIVPPLRKFRRKNCKIFAKIQINAWFIFGLTIDLLSDLILVVWPWIMLYRVKLSRPKDRPLVVVALGCSIFTFLLVVVVAIFSYGPITKDRNSITIVLMLVHMTAAVALIVCNTPVVACAAYRAIQRARRVRLGTVSEMPDASSIDNAGGDWRSGPPCSLSSPAVLKVTPTGETRLTYEDLTRISLSFGISEVPGTSLTGTSNAQRSSAQNQA